MLQDLGNPGQVRVAWQVEARRSSQRHGQADPPAAAENAVIHGIVPKGAPGTIVVRAQRVGKSVRLDIVDDGVGLRSASAWAGAGIYGMGQKRA